MKNWSSKMLSFTINWHPDPHRNESARGYLLRIVDQNGFKGIENICRKAGTQFPHKIHVMSNQWENLLNVFTPVLHKDTPLIEMFEQHWSAKLYAKFDMSMSNLFSVNCRVCPCCIGEKKGYAKADWDFALSTVCTKHNCELIDSCPHCDEKISWRRNELDKCPSCEGSYSSASINVLPKDDALLKLSRTLQRVNRKKIEQIVAACARMYRPQDNLLAAPSLHFMSLAEIKLLLLQALGLMHSESFRKQYQNWLRQTRKKYTVISQNAVLAPYLDFLASFSGKLNNRLGDIDFILPTEQLITINKSDISKPVPFAHNLGIKAARLKNIRADINEIDLSAQINARGMAAALCVPFSSIQHMLNGRVLIPTNDVGTIKHRMFDLNDVYSLIRNVSSKTPHTDTPLISLSSLAGSELLSKFALKFHHVIEAVLQRKLDVYFDNDDEGVFEGEVSEAQLIKVLEERMHEYQEKMNMSQLAQVLNTTPLCVNELVQLGLIKVNTVYVKTDSLTKSVTEDSLKEFMANYLSINRMSYFTDIRIDKLLRLLKMQNVVPSVIATDGKSTLYLIKRAAKSSASASHTRAANEDFCASELTCYN